MTCQHVLYHKIHGEPEQRMCADCGLTWSKHSGELRFAEGQTFGPVALRLLTPREDRIELTLLTPVWNELTPVQA